MRALRARGWRVIGHDRFRRAGFRRDFHLKEAVVLINALDALTSAENQRLAVDSMPVENIGGVHAEQIHQRCGVEVVVAVDGDVLYAAARSQLHVEKNVDAIGAGRLRFCDRP